MSTELSAITNLSTPTDRTNAESVPSGPQSNDSIASSSSTSLSMQAVDVELSASSLEVLRQSGGPLQQFRFNSLQAGFESVRVAAQQTRVENGVMRTASLLYRRATVDIKFSSMSLERFAKEVRELQDIDPELLNDFLALIKLLDEKTPDALDPFFDKLQNILTGNSDAEVPSGANGTIDVNVPVDASASTGEQVQAFFFHVRTSITEVSITFEEQVNKADPLVLDLDGDGVEVSSHEDGITFDIDADGIFDSTAFVAGGDAFLALDRNGNGTIDNGSELFGEHHGSADGFKELARFDDNNDNVIDKNDSIFGELKLFNGISTRTLAEANIASLDLRMQSALNGQINGNEVLGVSSFTRNDGTRGEVSDVLLNFTT